MVLAFYWMLLPLRNFPSQDQIPKVYKTDLFLAIKASSLKKLQNEARDLILAEFTKPKCHFHQVGHKLKKLAIKMGKPLW